MAHHADNTGQRADARRNFDRILTVAEQLFASEGIGVPFRRVATEAGVGQGTLYRHFPSKLDLVIEIYRRRLDRYEQFVRDHDHDPHVLRDVLRAVAAGQRLIPDLFRIIELSDSGALGAQPQNAQTVASRPDVVMLRRRTEQIFGLALRRSQASGGAATRLQVSDVLIMISMLFGAANSPLARVDRDDAIGRGLAIIEIALTA